MCVGTQTIVLLKEDVVLLRISNHHSESIRTNRWSSDTTISDKKKWFKWFDERSIKGPREELERVELLRNK